VFGAFAGFRGRIASAALSLHIRPRVALFVGAALFVTSSPSLR